MKAAAITTGVTGRKQFALPLGRDWISSPTDCGVRIAIVDFMWEDWSMDGARVVTEDR